MRLSARSPARLGWLLVLGASACVGRLGPLDRDPDAVPEAILTPTIVRLTNTAYRNTVRDLFPGVTLPELTLPADLTVGDFDNDALAQAPTPDLIRGYQANAALIHQALAADWGTVAGCPGALDEPCARAYLVGLARRAFRRPLTSEEQVRIEEGLATRAAQFGLSTGIGLVLEGILQAPAFLYRIEEGTLVDGDPTLARLGPHELAARLSYFLWNTMPDEALSARADDGTILEPAVLEAEARRLLADPRAHAAVAHMQRHWLRFAKMDSLDKDRQMFPMFGPEVAEAMRASAERFIEHAFWEEGTLEAMLTDSHAYVNEALAPVYGIPGISGDDLVLASADATQRSGVLTQAGLLAAFGHDTTGSPVLRGVFVLDRILCTPPPPPPPDVADTPPRPTAGEQKTTSQRYLEHEQGSCAGCHRAIDGVGFGFENFDAMGMWRTVEAGQPVDASGAIVGTNEIDGPFTGAVELGQRLAHSRTAAGCVVKKWVQYGLGLDPSQLSSLAVYPIRERFRETGNLRELLVLIATSTTFRYRTVQP